MGRKRKTEFVIRGRDRKPLIDFINENSENVIKFKEFKKIYDPSKLHFVTINEWIDFFKSGEEFTLVDVRSEFEYEEDHLPGAINFPILDNIERDEVGFLYKQHSPEAAYFMADTFAKRKMDKIREFAEGIKNSDKPLFVYCWRGGGRSTAAGIIFKELGLNPIKISLGYKGYRKKIYQAFYEKPDMYNYIPLTGLTGCGKTKIIETLNGKVPTFDIEWAASHASSIFGKIRYNVKGESDVTRQIIFENRLFSELIKPVEERLNMYLTEGESKKINKFTLPNDFHDYLVASPAIKLVTSMENRIKRIIEEYFLGDGKNSIYTLVKKSDFIKRNFGMEKINSLLNLLENDRDEEFCEWFLAEYYDKRYAGKYRNIIAEVSGDNLNSACEEVLEIMRKRGK